MDAPHVADRMARAIETALPLIDDMWGQFPYATQTGDDEVMTELREAVAAYRRETARAPPMMENHKG